MYDFLRGTGIEDGSDERDEGQSEDQAIKYLEENQVLTSEEGKLVAKWKYSFEDTDPGVSTYAPLAIESLWNVLDQMEVRDSEHQTIEELLTRTEDHFRLWHEEKRWQDALPKPSGRHLFQPSLMQGVGIWVNKGPCVDRGYRRATVKWLEAQVFEHICVNTGAKAGRWTNSWVFCKDPSDEIKQDKAECFYELFSADDEAEVAETARRHGLMRGDCHSYRNIRSIINEHTLVFEMMSGSLVDTHSDFMKHAISEHYLFMLLRLNKVKRPVAVVLGDPPPATVARARAKVANRERRLLAEASYLARRDAGPARSRPPAAAPATPPMPERVVVDGHGRCPKRVRLSPDLLPEVVRLLFQIRATSRVIGRFPDSPGDKGLADPQLRGRFKVLPDVVIFWERVPMCTPISSPCKVPVEELRASMSAGSSRNAPEGYDGDRKSCRRCSELRSCFLHRAP